MDEQQNLPPPAPVAVVRPTSTMAIVSLVSGILGWTLLPWIGSIVAIITGHMARKEIRQSGGTIDGDGMATAGLVLGWLCFGLGVLAIILTIVLVVFVFGSVAALLIGLGASGQLH